MDDPGYGITATGYSLKGQTRESAMTIAVDPHKIPLGSQVLVFIPNKPEFNGVYTARDVGGAIKGNHIDLFIGDFSTQDTTVARGFGRQQGKIIVLDGSWQ